MRACVCVCEYVCVCVIEHESTLSRPLSLSVCVCVCVCLSVSLSETRHITRIHWGQQRDSHALKQYSLSQSSSLSTASFLLVIASVMHPSPATEKRVKSVDFHAVKNLPKQGRHSFFFSSPPPLLLLQK